MNQIQVSKLPENYNSACFDVARVAERELTAFFGAVTELFGTEQAELSAEDWVQEVQAMNGLPTTAREWRQVTVKVLARLASPVPA